MGNGSTRPGDAVADKSRDEMRQLERGFENAVQRIHVRADVRSDPDVEETSEVVDQRVLEARARQNSDPPNGYGKDAVWLIKAVKGWPQAVFGLGLLFLLGFVAWLKWGR